ncbi:MAG: aldehyde dehydrogenase family protein [Acidimicrobiia bacterium]
MPQLVQSRQPYIDGKYLSGDGPEIQVEHPADESIIATVESVSEGQIEQAITAARRSFDDGVWANLSKHDRIAALKKMAGYLQDRRDLIVDTVIGEAGAPWQNATQVQVGPPLQHIDDILWMAEQLDDQEYNPIPPNRLNDCGKVGVSMNLYEPIGVVGAISAYNFPFYLNVWKVFPALVQGCSVVLRPSPLTPLSATIFGEAADVAGIPAGVLNIIPDAGIEGGKLLTTHPAVDMVTFTGSSKVGAEIMAQAAGTVKKVHLELGGKSASIYLPDDAENGWQMCMGVFVSHAGQGCALTTRILVPDDRKEEVIEQAKTIGAMLPMGDPYDQNTMIGPLVNDAAVKRSRHFTELAVQDGATVVMGGDTPEGDQFAKGHWFAPTLLDVPSNANRAAQEEIFGPVACVIGYKDVEDAVRIANDSQYGLAGMVWGATDQAVEVAKRIRSGTVWVNGAAPSSFAPFGGYKKSGIGREMGLHGLREYQEVKHLFVTSPGVAMPKAL